MTLQIDFTPREEAWLAAQAAQQGLQPAEIIKKLVDEHLPPEVEIDETDKTVALFAQWDKEDASRTPEETAANDKLWQEFELGINATRQALGMRLL
jgi:hypothetical protein